MASSDSSEKCVPVGYFKENVTFLIGTDLADRGSCRNRTCLRAVLPGFLQSVFVSSDAVYGLSSLKESADVSQSRAE